MTQNSLASPKAGRMRAPRDMAPVITASRRGDFMDLNRTPAITPPKALRTSWAAIAPPGKRSAHTLVWASPVVALAEVEYAASEVPVAGALHPDVVLGLRPQALDDDAGAGSPGFVGVGEGDVGVPLHHVAGGAGGGGPRGLELPVGEDGEHEVCHRSRRRRSFGGGVVLGRGRSVRCSGPAGHHPHVVGGQKSQAGDGVGG